jgi:hypothetical protein
LLLTIDTQGKQQLEATSINWQAVERDGTMPGRGIWGAQFAALVTNCLD